MRGVSGVANLRFDRYLAGFPARLAPGAPRGGRTCWRRSPPGTRSGTLLREGLRRLRRRRHHARELATLQKLASFSPAPCDLVLRRADRLFRAAAGFDGHQIAIPL